MKKGLRAAVLSGLLAVTGLPAAHCLAARPCGDFLALSGNKAQGLDFMACHEVERPPVKALEAKYRVEGSAAERVENFLHRETGMPLLTFVCCGWESGAEQGEIHLAGSADDPGGTDCAVSMHSAEALETCRELWEYIPWFYITVTCYTEEP